MKMRPTLSKICFFLHQINQHSKEVISLSCYLVCSNIQPKFGVFNILGLDVFFIWKDGRLKLSAMKYVF